MLVIKDFASDDLKTIYNLLQFCDVTKVHFRSQHQTIAEELFSYLEFKVGIMFEMIVFYSLEKTISDPILPRYHADAIPANAMKIHEVQHLILPQVISVIESSLRHIINTKRKSMHPMMLAEILEWLYKKKIINSRQVHLWTGIRQIRNAIVHYSRHATVTDTYVFSENLVIKLENSQKIASTTDLYEDAKLIEWMIFDVRNIVFRQFEEQRTYS